jgi:hypothetical protein
MQHHRPIETDAEAGEIRNAPAAGGGAPAVRGGPAEGDAPRLVKRTYLDKEQGRYKANLIDYGEGLAEVGWAFIPNRSPYKGSARGESENRSQNEDRAVRRARSSMRKKVLAHGLDHLLTLTYRENVTDFQRANDDLSRFMRLLKKHRPEFHYVAVPEQQKRGAWHWHLAVKGRQDVDLLRTLWHQVAGEGNIDVQKPKAGQNRRLGLVKYLSKYLAKGFELGLRELNGHRYRSSLGMTVPTEPIPIPEEARGKVSGYVLEKLVERGGAVGYVWTNDTGAAGWACSWK